VYLYRRVEYGLLVFGIWYLAIAIAAEVIATLALKASDGFANASNL
jgi:multidrug transporter EmrE-like cation transporter